MHRMLSCLFKQHKYITQQTAQHATACLLGTTQLKLSLSLAAAPCSPAMHCSIPYALLERNAVSFSATDKQANRLVTIMVGGRDQYTAGMQSK